MTTQFKFGVLRKAHMFEDLQGHHLPFALLFLVVSLITQSLPAYAIFAGFTGVWLSGIFAKREVFYFLNFALVIAIFYIMCQMPVH